MTAALRLSYEAVWCLSMASHVAVVGAGFSGAVVGRELAEAGHRVTIFESRPHVAGNCYTERDDETNVLVHTYGPHIFHTRFEHVWEYIRRFGEMRPYTHRVKATVGGGVYSLPVNLHTINQFFSATMTPSEARAFVAGKARTDLVEPSSFEEQGLRMVGPELYEAFFAGYTQKQWGTHPSDLPASILTRLPLRFNYDDSYFDHPYQAIPANGYTPIVEAILDHPLIDVKLAATTNRAQLQAFDHAVWTGPIDAYFDFEFGRLPYRTLDFQREIAEGDVQGCPVMNYCDADVPFTRITEHKHFAPWETHEKSVTYREFSRACGSADIPYYPVRLVHDKALLHKYIEKAELLSGVTFVGRLGTYRYLDMDVTIKEALDVAALIVEALANEKSIPVFAIDPSA